MVAGLLTPSKKEKNSWANCRRKIIGPAIFLNQFFDPTVQNRVTKSGNPGGGLSTRQHGGPAKPMR